jgi:hypothetical protein
MPDPNVCRILQSTILSSYDLHPRLIDYHKSKLTVDRPSFLTSFHSSIFCSPLFTASETNNDSSIALYDWLLGLWDGTNDGKDGYLGEAISQRATT